MKEIEVNTGISKQVTFTERSAKEFESCYNTAVSNGEREFTFQGNDYYVGYAKYLIEYLKTRGLLK